MKTLTEYQTKRINQRPPMWRGALTRSLQGKASPREAIKAQCIECQGADGGVREAVRDCGDRCCPLWNYRPYQQEEQ